MPLDLKLLSTMIPGPYGTGPEITITGYLNPHELRLNRALDKKYYKYCDKYINDYIRLMNNLYYGLFVEPDEYPPANQLGYDDWNNHRNKYDFFNTIIENNNTTKTAFYEKYVEIFMKMFNLNNIDEFSYSNINHLISKCNPEIVSMYENQHLDELVELKHIIHESEMIAYSENY